jgi:DNA-binding NarL/FixJ family response regulator
MRDSIVAAAGEASGGGVVDTAVVSAVRFYRESLVELLRGRLDLRVIATATTAAELPPLPAGTVIVLDVAFAHGADDAAALTANGFSVVAVAIAETDDDVVVLAESGVIGFVGRNGSVEEIAAAVVCASRNETRCSSQVAGALLRRVHDARSTPSKSPNALTPREREIAGLLQRGLSNKEIAAMLSIQTATVKNHVHAVLGKLNVRRRADVVPTRGRN